MGNDIRVYNYYDDTSLITRETQAKKYFDEKFANVHVDVDLSEVTQKLDDIDAEVEKIDNGVEKIDTVVEKIDAKLDKIDTEVTKIDLGVISNQLSNVKEEIVEAIEEAKPCLCHLATKEDVCEAKCEIVKKIESSKEEIIKDIDEKFVDLNELIK